MGWPEFLILLPVMVVLAILIGTVLGVGQLLAGRSRRRRQRP